MAEQRFEKPLFDKGEECNSLDNYNAWFFENHDKISKEKEKIKHGYALCNEIIMKLRLYNFLRVWKGREKEQEKILDFAEDYLMESQENKSEAGLRKV